MKVKVKSKEELIKQLIYFIEEYGKYMSDEGFLSKDSFIDNEMDRIDFIADKIMDVQKIIHTDGTYHYRFVWFVENGKNCYGNIQKEDIENIVEV